MKTELLVQMDGLARSSDLVFVLAASNLPWSDMLVVIGFTISSSSRELDHAMLRRLEKRILVDLPTESARRAMVCHHLPAVISQHPVEIRTAVDYDTVARVRETATWDSCYCMPPSSQRGTLGPISIWCARKLP